MIIIKSSLAGLWGNKLIRRNVDLLSHQSKAMKLIFFSFVIQFPPFSMSTWIGEGGGRKNILIKISFLTFWYNSKNYHVFGGFPFPLLPCYYSRPLKGRSTSQRCGRGWGERSLVWAGRPVRYLDLRLFSWSLRPFLSATGHRPNHSTTPHVHSPSLHAGVPLFNFPWRLLELPSNAPFSPYANNLSLSTLNIFVSSLSSSLFILNLLSLPPPSLSILNLLSLSPFALHPLRILSCEVGKEEKTQEEEEGVRRGAVASRERGRRGPGGREGLLAGPGGRRTARRGQQRHLRRNSVSVTWHWRR